MLRLATYEYEAKICWINSMPLNLSFSLSLAPYFCVCVAICIQKIIIKMLKLSWETESEKSKDFYTHTRSQTVCRCCRSCAHVCKLEKDLLTIKGSKRGNNINGNGNCKQMKQQKGKYLLKFSRLSTGTKAKSKSNEKKEWKKNTQNKNEEFLVYWYFFFILLFVIFIHNFFQHALPYRMWWKMCCAVLSWAVLLLVY